MRTVAEIVAEMDLRFTSANEIEVERAHVRRAEWDTLRAALIAAVDVLAVQGTTLEEGAHRAVPLRAIRSLADAHGVGIA